MNFELSKPQKKIARQIIELGLQREYENGITKIENVINKWKSGKLDNQKAYLEMYKKLIQHDKHMGRRYDDMTGSKYLLIIISQLADKVISMDEINEFDDEVKEVIYKWLEITKD
ncbi:MAG TPA: hypothetical protein VLQ91_10815 [Draconibacterium sp.]|jgi:hypothetical protein|nr:hypothetical protein [Draconibacterium sp.]